MADIIDIKVPEMGESISEGTISAWFRKKGEFVKADEPVVEIETDKVTQEVPSPASGVLTEILFEKGSTVTVKSVIARLDVSAAAPQASAPAPAPAAAPVATTPALAATVTPATSVKNETLPPAAAKIVRENNLDPAAIAGTGKRDQVTTSDVIRHMSSPAPAATKAKASHAGREEVVPMTRLRRAIAERLVSAQHNAAILTTFNEVDMHNVMDIRNRYKDGFEKKHGTKLGFMSFFVKAVVNALREIPAVNAEIRGTDIVYKNYHDIGVAVGGPKGLVVPIVRNCGDLSLFEIEAEIARLADRVKTGSITLDEMQDGTFTISNGGVYGSMLSTPILNPPQSGILGMHNIVKRPVVVNDQIVIRPVMYLALSYDHRIIDGKEAVTFLVRVKEAIEDPVRLLLEV